MASNAIAIIVLGFFLVLGSGCATDYLFLASMSVEEEKYETAVQYLKQGANEGDRRCDYYLAVLMLSGDLAGGRYPKAASEWLRNAAVDGHSLAQLKLGRLYEMGDGVNRDLVQAVELYRTAAAAGAHAAQAHLGVLYATGRGVDQDSVMAAKWYRKSARGGDALGQVAFGRVTFRGVGVPKDVVDGYVWTKLAANQGNAEARASLPVMISEMTIWELKRARYEASKAVEKASKKGAKYNIKIFDSKRSASQRARGMSGR